MKRTIITGGNSGIGYQAAKQLVQKGWQVTLFCRNERRAKEACRKITEETGSGQVDYKLADLADIRSVRQAAAAYLEQNRSLDVLINNAADFDLSVKKRVLTRDGLEKQFATNVLAPYLLSELLLPALEESSDGRILNISSKGLIMYPRISLDFDNLNGEKSYSPSKTYYQNKLALLMLSLYQREQYPKVSVQAVRVTNVKLDISRYPNLTPVMKAVYRLKSRFSIPAEKMAEVYTALASEAGFDGFLYDEHCKEVKANRSAYNKTEQERLYRLLGELARR
ncbi:SDR family NAD(P)-dependent oxidoreductase [Streptococcus pantholopis]|uniref:Dehydrogenase n=1 Tax=Streptococcus pantholopis TaxID=1811193 RepID=A0A172Q574_9STRE|nr:SDR family NAD(P)-dependent oxidoreductase [Streptococcus pantholopis]AND78607.1 dehydrogenase [Streptococcus pantholopis]